MLSEIEPEAILEDLIAKPAELEWLEFKSNYLHHEQLGKTLSSLANAAALEAREDSYLVFGIENETHAVLGTTFNVDKEKVGSNPLKNWISVNLSPCPAIQYYAFEFKGKPIVMIRIHAALHFPVKFKGIEYIRVGSAVKPLSAHPEIAKSLWAALNMQVFEKELASGILTAEQILELIDHEEFYKRLGEPVPSDPGKICSKLISKGVVKAVGRKYAITNMGALLFAKKLEDFEHLERKGVRVVKYKNNDKTVTESSFDGGKGYVVGIDGLLGLLRILTPSEEFIDVDGSRKVKRTYSSEVLRELVVNAFIHQDLAATGTSPIVEIYPNRIEITNPGSPLLDTYRFLDSAQSRNEKLAKLARDLRICEEKGSGVDKAVIWCEQNYLPPPTFESSDNYTRVTLHVSRTLRQFTAAERTYLVYMHCSIHYLSHNPMTNETLRNRFPDDVMSSTVASRWIKEALKAGHIKPQDPTSKSKKYVSYIPNWA